jgi:hypothetical protein
VITVPVPCSLTEQQVELLAVGASRGKWTNKYRFVFTEYFSIVYESKFPKPDASLNLNELDYDVNTESNKKGNKGSVRRLSRPLKMVFLNSVINPVPAGVVLGRRTAYKL